MPDSWRIGSARLLFMSVRILPTVSVAWQQGTSSKADVMAFVEVFR